MTYKQKAAVYAEAEKYQGMADYFASRGDAASARKCEAKAAELQACIAAAEG